MTDTLRFVVIVKCQIFVKIYKTNIFLKGKWDKEASYKHVNANVKDQNEQMCQNNVGNSNNK